MWFQLDEGTPHIICRKLIIERKIHWSMLTGHVDYLIWHHKTNFLGLRDDSGL